VTVSAKQQYIQPTGERKSFFQFPHKSYYMYVSQTHELDCDFVVHKRDIVNQASDNERGSIQVLHFGFIENGEHYKIN